jgi:rhamnosyltransferase subunit B
MTPLRIVIFAIGSAGDVHPFMGIGVALQQRGHEVFLATSPLFEHEVTASGLGFRPLGTMEDFHRIKDDPDLWHPVRSFPAIIRHAVDPSHAAILEISRDLQLPGKTVMLASSLAFAALTARDLLGIPLATIHLAPSLLPSIHHQPLIHGMPFGNRAPRFLKRLQWHIAGKVVDHHARPGFNRFRGSLGLSPIRGLLAGGWNSPDRVIALFPAWFAAPQPDWPSQLVQTGFPLFDSHRVRPVSPELDQFLAAGPPPVIFTPGSAMAHGRPFFSEAAEAVRKLGCRAVFLTPFTATVPENLPPGVAHFDYAPFSEILPRSAALVYHGGIGTCAQALQAGIPQLIRPMAHDQFDTLARIRELGVGLGITSTHRVVDALVEALQPLLNDSVFRQRARNVQTRFEPGPWLTQTCTTIEALGPTLNR